MMPGAERGTVPGSTASGIATGDTGLEWGTDREPYSATLHLRLGSYHLA